MEQTMVDVAQAGDIDSLYILLQENPFVLNNIDKSPFSQTPLHIAVSSRQTRFAKEIANLKPSFVTKLDHDGLSPVHLASATGQVELVKEFLSINSTLHLLKGREKRTPLHCAAMTGQIEVINLLCQFYSQCLAELTIRKETALHIAVKYNQLEAFNILLQWLKEIYEDEAELAALFLATKGRIQEKFSAVSGKGKLLDTKEILNKILAFSFEKSEVEDFIMIRDDLMKIKKEGLLNLKDDEGNTVLHLAVFTKQHKERPLDILFLLFWSKQILFGKFGIFLFNCHVQKMIEAILCSNTTAEVCHVDVNATNMNNLTALDIFMLLPREEGDEQVESALRCAGAVSASQIITPSSSVTQPKRKLYMFGRVASKDLQNRTFLISLLVASICLFNILHPPGGVWQVNLQTYSNSSNITFADTSTTTASHRVGTAVMATWPFTFYLFIIFNVHAFFISSIVMVILTVGSPLMPSFVIALVLMSGALVLSLAFITPEEHLNSYIFPFLMLSTFGVTFCTVSAWNRHKNRKASAARDDEVQEKIKAA
ncbi:Ankyrin repeat [Dillenia turbinata]|uniref:Ankyrin repeat n=1 Tax=Dillenia turbinata TaxID=194707 RepID=A0AAN8UM15_9MAGN